MRKTILLLGSAVLVLLGAGCGEKPSAIPGASNIPPEDRVMAAPAEKPTAQPQIPEDAKNIPRPGVK